MTDLFGATLANLGIKLLTADQMRQQLFAILSDGETHELLDLCAALGEPDRKLVIQRILDLSRKQYGRHYAFMRGVSRSTDTGGSVRLSVNPLYNSLHRKGEDDDS